MKKLLIALACLAVASLGSAQIITDGPGNHSFGAASAINLPSGDFSAVGVGDLSSGFVDFYSINLQAGELLTTAVTPLGQGLTSPELELGLFDSSETLVAIDTGISGNGFQSVASTQAMAAGTYYIGVTGSGDDQFTGNHDQSGPYQILVGVTPAPEPASLSVLALGGLALLRRRSASKGDRK